MSENAVKTRSKTLSVNDRDNMAENNMFEDNNSKAKSAFKTPAKMKALKDKGDKGEKSLKSTKSEKIKDIDAEAIKGQSKQHVISPQLSVEVKGIVADRVEKINNTPTSSPVPNKPTSATNRRKMLSARNGQLVIQEDDDGCFPGQFLHDYQQHDYQSVSNQSVADEDEYTTDGEDEGAAIDLPSILRELSSNVKRLERSVRKMSGDQQVQQNQMSTIEAIQSQDTTKLRGIIDKLDDQEDKIDMLVGIIARQDIQIQALSNKWDAAFAKENKNNIIISGMAETQGENCFHEVANFLKAKLKVDTPVQLIQAYRMGQGKTRPMVAKLKDTADKAKIFSKVSNLKQINKGRQKPYFVTDQLPEAMAEKKRYNHYLKMQNLKLPDAQQLPVAYDRGVLSFDAKPYQPPIKPLSPAQKCKITPERKRMLRDLEFIQGALHEESDSLFVGYASSVDSAKQVQDFYDALCVRVPDATHIACAFRLPGTDITTCQGSIDDGEHGAGRTLLNMLAKSKVHNKAVFITRHYGGRHIGAMRFQLIEKAAQEALDILLHKEKEAAKPLTEEQLRQLNLQIAEQERQRVLEQQQRDQHPWNQSIDTDDENIQQQQDQPDDVSQVSSQG